MRIRSKRWSQVAEWGDNLNNRENIEILRILHNGGTLSLKSSYADDIEGADWSYMLNGESIGQDEYDDPLISSIWYCQRAGYITEPLSGDIELTPQGRIRLTEEYG